MDLLNNGTTYGPFSREVLQDVTWRYPLKRGAPKRLTIADLAEWNARTKPARPVFPRIPLTYEEAVTGKRPPRLRLGDLGRFWFGLPEGRPSSSVDVELVYREILAYDWNRWDAKQLHLLLVERGPLAEATASTDPFERRCGLATTVLSSFLDRALERIARREEERRCLEGELERRVYRELVARDAESPDWTVCESCTRLLRLDGNGRPPVRCKICKPSRFTRTMLRRSRVVGPRTDFSS